MKRSEIENFDVSKDITITKDGDSFCALLGSDIQSGKVGFGNTEMDALDDLRPKLTTREYSRANVFKVSENDL